MKPHEWATRAMADMGAGIRDALIQAFKEAILAEREACARLADAEAGWVAVDEIDRAMVRTAEDLAKKIRARSDG